MNQCANKNIVLVLALLVVIVIGLSVRYLGISQPPYDTHPFRQCQTLSTIEDFSEHGIDVFHPRTNYVGYPGYLVLEFPLFQAMGAILYGIFGGKIEIIRILNILFGMLSCVLVFLISKKFFDYQTGLYASLVYFLAPINMIYQRSTLVDPMAVFLGLLTFYLIAEYLSDVKNKEKKSYMVAFPVAILFLTNLSILVKGLYLLPAGVLFFYYLFYQKFRFAPLEKARSFQAGLKEENQSFGSGLKSLLNFPKGFTSRAFVVFIIFLSAGITFLLWNYHAGKVNQMSFFTKGLKPTTLLGIAKAATFPFYVKMAERFFIAWVGPMGAISLFYVFIYFVVNIKKREIRGRILLFFTIPVSYLLLFANINYPHTYYQLILTPFLSSLAGFGLSNLINSVKKCQPRIRIIKVQKYIHLVLISVVVISSLGVYFYLWKPYELNANVMSFHKLSSQKYNRWSYAIIFVDVDKSSGAPLHGDSPAFLYAGELQGVARIVNDINDAYNVFVTIRQHFNELSYLIFYGLDYPHWVKSYNMEDYIIDPQNKYYSFRTKP